MIQSLTLKRSIDIAGNQQKDALVKSFRYSGYSVKKSDWLYYHPRKSYSLSSLNLVKSIFSCPLNQLSDSFCSYQKSIFLPYIFTIFQLKSKFCHRVVKRANVNIGRGQEGKGGEGRGQEGKDEGQGMGSLYGIMTLTLAYIEFVLMNSEVWKRLCKCFLISVMFLKTIYIISMNVAFI